MKDHFAYFYDKYINADKYISTERVGSWMDQVIKIIFPVDIDLVFHDASLFESYMVELQSELAAILKCSPNINPVEKAEEFFQQLPKVRGVLETDVHAIYNGDPAAKSEVEVIRCYPGIYAITAYRMAHLMHQQGIKTVPRMLTEFAHGKTGIDIHPEAKINSHFFIDHGTGVVIGATANIGSNVKIYQGVTLGGLSVNKKDADVKRHPTIENHVVIYAGATILGGKTVIGEHSIIGGNTFITKSIPPRSKIYHTPNNQIK
jgi:serine O-acetyltransferase